MEPVELQGTRVRLRPHRICDVDAVVRQVSDPETQAWSGLPVPYTRAHAMRYILKTAPAGWRAGNYLALAAVDPETDAFLGTVDVRLDGTGAGEIGYGFGPWARGRGIATEAVRLFLDWIFDPSGLDVHVVIWHAYVGNWASRRVAWKLGFRIEGAVRDVCRQREVRRDAWIGSLRRSDPREPVTTWLRVPTLLGDRIAIRPWRPEDAEACVQACNDPVIRYWLADVPNPYSLADARTFLSSREDAHAAGTGISWAVSPTVDGAALGSFSLERVDLKNGTGEIGYWVHPAGRGRGVAPRAVGTILDWALAPDGLGLQVITLRAAVTNTASQRVAEKVGFRRVGLIRRDHLLGDGSRADTVLFDCVAGEREFAPVRQISGEPGNTAVRRIAYGRERTPARRISAER